MKVQLTAHDHVAALGLPEPAEVAPAPPPERAPEEVRLSPADVGFASSPWRTASPITTYSPLVAALHARAGEALRAAPSDALRAVVQMTSRLTELDALAARVRTEQRGWLRA